MTTEHAAHANGHHHDHDHHQHEPVDYAEAVEAYRADKDHYFKHGDGSPIPAAERDAFRGLAYFPVDRDLRFEERTLEPYIGTEPQRFAIPTSDGGLRPAHRAGSLRFELAGEPRSLAAYVLDDPSHVHERAAAVEDHPTLFVPFLDATSGTETYGAGRYLDIEPEDDGTYSLDFNVAYHPSCVHDPHFSCPLTPAENRLAERIEAGERLPVEGS